MALKQSHSVKSRSSHKKSSPNTGPMSPAIETLGNLPQSDLLPMELQSMSSAEVSRAKMSARPGNDAGLKKGRAAVFTPKCLELLATYDRDSSSWRTSQVCLVALVNNEGGWFGRVLGDLAECGFHAEWENIPAAALGGAHVRERVWLVAYPNSFGLSGRRVFSALDRTAEAEFSGRKFHVNKTDYDGLGSSVWNAAAAGVWGVDHGLPDRLDRFKAIGNAVVPQIPELIGNAILAAINSARGSLTRGGRGGNTSTPAPALFAKVNE